MQRVMMALSLPLRTALLVGLALGALGTVGLMDQVRARFAKHTAVRTLYPYTHVLGARGSWVGAAPCAPCVRRKLCVPMCVCVCVCVCVCARFTQVASDVGMHCMMAEAAVRIAHLEETVTKIRHDELLTQVRHVYTHTHAMLVRCLHTKIRHDELLIQVRYVYTHTHTHTHTHDPVCTLR